jgi:hypothetical protein
MNPTAAIRLPERPWSPSEQTPSPRRQIEVVPSQQQRRARPKVMHALVAVVGVFVVIGAQLGLSIALSAGAYEIGDLQDRQRDLERTQQALDEQLQVLSSTQHLALNASALGMVPGGSQFYLDLGTGAIATTPGMPNPFGCGNGCTLVPNSLSSGLALASAPVGAKVVGTVSKPAVDPAVAATTTGVAADPGAAVAVDPAGAVASGVDEGAAATGGAVASPDAPVASDSLPSPVTH